ncbi:MAG TPA: tRNA (adenosine(37)-N6)-threonylcarbamoyltransferase complex dimerization subunit type 1 TsaB [Gemmatimonadaceae bacterium]|nr:tRNA (adenosine(37)-N6)-threonylcarbamoyltransferase complex dimerization subunit type 1 TsaB [Gemmatimonadaceae bacterium]
MLTLAVDASTSTGSVAVVAGDRVLVEREVAMRGEHAERLMPAVADALRESGATAEQVERIVCGAGPGSFTGLRIAASIAKGLAVGWSVPLLAVPSPLLMIAGAPATADSGRYLAVLDAMRGDVFASCYELHEDGGAVEVAAPALIPRSEVAHMAASHAARVMGPGEPINAVPRARGVARLRCWLAERECRVDMARWEPDYGRHAEAQVRWEAAHGRPLPGG